MREQKAPVKQPDVRERTLIRKPMTKDEITRPGPGSLPARISFIEQTGGAAGYYVRFKDVPGDSSVGGNPDRPYIPILQYDSTTRRSRPRSTTAIRRPRSWDFQLKPPGVLTSRRLGRKCPNRTITLVSGGIAYHHISDTCIALFSRFIACGVWEAVWEAVYILDGLLGNESVLQTDTFHADTHGQSEPVFGLAHLLRIRLMSRMRNISEVACYRPSSDASYEHVDALFSPYMTAHLKRFGQYILDTGGPPPPLEPKPLDLVDEESPLR